MGTLPQLAVVKGPLCDLQPSLIHRLFEYSLADRKHFTSTALIEHRCEDSEHRTSYAQLNEAANRYARCIRRTIDAAAGIPNADGDWIVAVCMAPSTQLITTLLAIWKSGAAYLPIDPTFPRQRVEHILAEAKPALVVYDADAFEDANEAFAGRTNITAKELQRLAADEHVSSNDLCDDETLGSSKCSGTELAIVLYTSGSTGVPKGVRMPHSILQNRLQWQFAAFPFAATEKTGVFKTALTFVDSVSEIWGPLLKERAVLIIPKSITKDPERLVDILERHNIRRMVLVPTLLRSLLLYLPMRGQKRLLHGLKIWVCSGEPLSVQLASEFYDYFVEGEHMLCNFYGSTEIMGDVTYFVCESKRQLSALDKVPIGYPISNTIVYVLNGDLQALRMGETGELYVAGLNLACGYVGGRDANRFVDNPLAVDPKFNRLYRTGDFASMRKDGSIQYEGRTDSQIKVRGHRVDLSEVEKQLCGLTALVDKGVVLCYRPGEIDQALVAFVVTLATKTSRSQDRDMPIGMDIEAALRDRLADYMLPQVLVLDTMPLLVNGKVDRQALLKTYENSNNNDDDGTVIEYDLADVRPEQKSMAKNLFETVGQAIGKSTRTSISLHSNFYELGGNSLNSIYTVAQLRNQGYRIGITDFITAKTLRQVLDKMALSASVSDSTDTDGSAVEKDIEDNELAHMRLRSTPLKSSDNSEVIELMTRSFFEKADLERWLKPNIMYTDYGDIFDAMYDHFVENEICFVVWDADDRMVGVALNTDANDEPEVEINNQLAIVFEFLEHIEGPIREHQLPTGKKQIFHTLMMGTNALLNAQQNIAVMQFMETEVLELARRKRFQGILTTNTSPLTQQLGSHVYGYETLLNYQVNEYIAPDGTRPFRKAPKSQRAIVQWKRIADNATDTTL